jgi:hypothetical protein
MTEDYCWMEFIAPRKSVWDYNSTTVNAGIVASLAL